MAMELLLGSDIGLMSLLTIGLVIVIGGFYVRFFMKNMEEDERRAKG